jgi:PAS domain S-box-containing protein
MRTENPDRSPDIQQGRQALLEAIRLTAEAVATTNSNDIFRDLVRSLATTLDVVHCFIGVLEPGKADEVSVIAGYFFRQFHEPFTYPLKDTPCENVIGQQYRYYPENVQQLFADPHIKELKTEGYAGIPLFGTDGDVLGLMAVAHSKPLRESGLVENLLRIYSVRVAIELERRNADAARSEKEKELRKSEDRVRATIESAIDSIIVMDREGNVIEFNPAAEQCFGYYKYEILGKPLAELIIPQRFRDHHNRGMQQYRENGYGAFLKKRVEVVAMRSDGSEFPAELAVDVAQGADGEIFIGYMRDISERREAEGQRRQLERQLQQAQKMEAIGQLTGGIAHDFNNILTSLLGYVSLAEDYTSEMGDERLMRYLERSMRAGNRARELIQQMLTFSRGQQGDPDVLELNRLIPEWTSLIESTFPSSVEILTEIDSEVPSTLIDPVQIEQVLMNLCINARDAMNGSGCINIKLSHRKDIEGCVCASCRKSIEQSDYIEIAVSDTGGGIPTDIQSRIFEPFYSTKEVGRGSGMGLSMVHGIVHRHNGHILLESIEEQLTCFRILLKRYEHQLEASKNSGVRSVSTDADLHGSVLLVDDEPAVSEFMQDLLESWSLDVTIFNDSVEANRHYAEFADHYPLVILDLTMPRMSGLELAEGLLKLRPHQAIILYTGYDADISEDQVRELGIKALVKKPIDTLGLRELVTDLIRH